MSKPDFDIRNLTGRTISNIRLYGDSAAPLGVDGVVLELDEGHLSIRIDYNDDSLHCVNGNFFAHNSELVEKEIANMERFTGVIAFAWELKRQSGIIDGLQIQLLWRDRTYHQLQFMAEGGCIMLYSLAAERLVRK